VEGVRHGYPAGDPEDRWREREGNVVAAPVSVGMLKNILHEYRRNSRPADDLAHVRVRRHAPDAQAARTAEVQSSLASALRDMQSKQQEVRKQLAAHIAKEAGMTLTGLTDAASVVPHPRAGVVQAVAHNDPEALNYAAAWYGMLAREPRLTVFHAGDQGGDILHVTNSPLGVSQILEAAGEHRLPGVTVSPDGGLHVLDPGGRNTRGVLGFLQAVRATKPQSHRGTAHRIGAASGDASDSRAAYRDVIKKFQVA
jgi:hypothetical protein